MRSTVLLFIELLPRSYKRAACPDCVFNWTCGMACSCARVRGFSCIGCDRGLASHCFCSSRWSPRRAHTFQTCLDSKNAQLGTELYRCHCSASRSQKRPARPAEIKSFTPACRVTPTMLGSTSTPAFFANEGIPEKPTALQCGIAFTRKVMAFGSLARSD